MTFVLALDQGTSATKAIVVDADGKIHGVAEVPVRVVADIAGGVEVNRFAVAALQRLALEANAALLRHRRRDVAAAEVVEVLVERVRERGLHFSRGPALQQHVGRVLLERFTVGRLHDDNLEDAHRH
ncbi:MAG: hypothetical protein AAB327_03370, partial [Actinomycetota bacterium]